MTDAVSRLTIAEVATPGNLVVEGEIDAHSASELASSLDPIPGDGDVHLDLSGVQFMDSSGLRVLIAAHERCEANGRRLVVVDPSNAVSRLLEISGLDEHFHRSSSASS